ncbi:hypothetical protein ASG35_11105 [Burkholderia sp. Leaf177]|nr:hypothetical protein ASG35_11105 [Burkholderia sp. Leaf177]
MNVILVESDALCSVDRASAGKHRVFFKILKGAVSYIIFEIARLTTPHFYLATANQAYEK